MGFSVSSVGKESVSNVGDSGSVTGLGRSIGEGKKLSTPVFWPGELRGLYPWSCKESDRTERLFWKFLKISFFFLFKLKLVQFTLAESSWRVDFIIRGIA